MFQDFDGFLEEAYSVAEVYNPQKYESYKKHFAGKHLLIDNVNKYTNEFLGGLEEEIIRLVMTTGGRIIATIHPDENSMNFINHIAYKYPKATPMEITLPPLLPAHAASAMRSKLSYADMNINEKQYHAIRGIADLGLILHSFQLAKVLEEIHKGSEVSFGQMNLFETDAFSNSKQGTKFLKRIRK